MMASQQSEYNTNDIKEFKVVSNNHQIKIYFFLNPIL